MSLKRRAIFFTAVMTDSHFASYSVLRSIGLNSEVTFRRRPGSDAFLFVQLLPKPEEGDRSCVLFVLTGVLSES